MKKAEHIAVYVFPLVCQSYIFRPLWKNYVTNFQNKFYQLFDIIAAILEYLATNNDKPLFVFQLESMFLWHI